MDPRILVIAESNGDTLTRGTREVIAIAQQLQAEDLVICLIGKGDSQAADELSQYKAGKVCVVEHDLLQGYSADGYCAALQQAVGNENPGYVLVPHSYQARDYIPKLAARFGRSVIADCVAVERNGDRLKFARQVFQGRVTTEVDACATGPAFITIQSGSADPASVLRSDSRNELTRIQPELSATDIRSQSEPPFRESAQAVDLDQADIIVAIGRGIKDPKNLEMIETFASLIGAEVAASRPVCDEGWLPIDRQVGSSGQSVAPKLYIAIGISGAIQHVIGMKASATIVAINKDANAPIFKIADYGIVGDLFDIIPALIAQLQKDDQ